MSAPLARTLPVLALYLAALHLGILTPGKRKRPVDFRQMELPK